MACPPGTYSLVPASKATRLVTKQLTEVAAGRLCLPCEYGATCEGKDKPVTLKGFWIKPLAHTRNANARRSEAEQEGQEEEKEGVLRAQVYRCPPAACVGGGKCAAGREGPVCGICSDQYSVRSGKCIRCTGSYAFFFLFRPQQQTPEPERQGVKQRDCCVQAHSGPGDGRSGRWLGVRLWQRGTGWLCGRSSQQSAWRRRRRVERTLSQGDGWLCWRMR